MFYCIEAHLGWLEAPSKYTQYFLWRNQKFGELDQTSLLNQKLLIQETVCHDIAHLLGSLTDWPLKVVENVE